METVVESEASEERALVLAGEFDAVEIFVKGRLGSAIGHITKLVEDIQFDMSTAKGRAACKSFAFSITKTKTQFEEAGKDLNKAARASIDKVDAGRRRWNTEVADLAEKAREPLTLWEAAEAKKKEELDALRDEILAYEGAIKPHEHSSEQMREIMNQLIEVQVDESYGYYKFDSERDKGRILKTMMDDISRKQDSEKAAIRLAELEAEKAERDKKDAEERAIKEAKELEEKRVKKIEEDRIAQRERDKRVADIAREQANRDAEKRAKDLEIERQKAIEAAKLKAEEFKKEAEAAIKKAEHEKIMAIKAANLALEKQEQAQEDARRKAEQDLKDKLTHERLAEEKRKANEAHINKIFDEIEEDLRAVDIFDSIGLRRLIQAGGIRHIKIVY